ncbi:MAG TPA: TadE/TadG family type IV pilus assembly protein [Blastococcus sp.]|nr:TadE/TadG family type IV pilus assembly protein [Blastococcus sp.]
MAERGPLCPPPLASSRRDPAEGPPDDGQRGSAVVDFVMVSMLIVALLLAVLQVAVYVHVRNVVTASAQEGARYAANADVDSALGAARTVEVVARATSEQTAEGLACTSAEEVDGSGLTLVVVRCTGSVPSLLAALGDLLPLTATGRALKEAA